MTIIYNQRHAPPDYTVAICRKVHVAQISEDNDLIGKTIEAVDSDDEGMVLRFTNGTFAFIRQIDLGNGDTYIGLSDAYPTVRRLHDAGVITDSDLEEQMTQEKIRLRLFEGV
jgi:hypothetical protein